MRIMIGIAALALFACTSANDGGVMHGRTGGTCAGIAAFQCEDGADYCKMKEGECLTIADVGGICTKKPKACTKDYRPVCGCDGETYSNACVAASNGVSVAAQGPCVEGS